MAGEKLRWEMRDARCEMWAVRWEHWLCVRFAFIFSFLITFALFLSCLRYRPIAIPETRTRTPAGTPYPYSSNAEAASLLGVNLFLIFIIYLSYAISYRLRRQQQRQRQRQRQRHWCQARSPFKEWGRHLSGSRSAPFNSIIKMLTFLLHASGSWAPVSGLWFSGLCTLACN